VHLAVASLRETNVRHARNALVERLVASLVFVGVVQWILDAIDLEEETRDRQTIARHLTGVDLAYDHRDTHGEPMLWVADAAAWLASGGRADAALECVEVP